MSLTVLRYAAPLALVLTIALAGCSSTALAAPVSPADLAPSTTQVDSSPTPSPVAPPTSEQPTSEPATSELVPELVPEPPVIEDLTPTSVAYATVDLNVRSGPGTTHPVVGRLARGAQIPVISTTDGWSRVAHPEAPETYVSASYLSQSEPDPLPAPPASGPRSTPPSTDGPRSRDDIVSSLVAAQGIDWGWDCLGTGPNVAAMAQDNKVCFRSTLTAAELPGLVAHEMHHVMMWRTANAYGMGDDQVEAHLRGIYDPAPLLTKSAGGYPALEVAADCWSRLQTGALASRSYASSCPAEVTAAAVSLWNGA